MSGEFAADIDAIKAQAQDFIGESSNVAEVVDQLHGVGPPYTGDGGLDGLIVRLLHEIRAAAGGLGMALEVDGRGLMANATTYESSDAESARLTSTIDERTVS